MERELIHKTEEDIQKLINLYLSPEFDPFGKDEGREEADAAFEDTKYGREEADAALDERNDDYEIKQLGRRIAQWGDDFDKGLTDQLAVTNQNWISTFQNISTTNEDEAWKKFNGIMVKSIESNGITDPLKILRSCLLALNGLKNLGSSVKLLANKFTMKFISQRNLSHDIARLGGLRVLEQDID